MQPDLIPYIPNPSLPPVAPLPDEQPVWERHVKRGLAFVVATCAGIVPVLSPTQDVVALKVCMAIIGIGAALGITSTGNRR